MSSPTVEYNYDFENDILYISLGKPRSSYSDDLSNGVVARYDFKTDELTGITILGFLQRFNNVCLPNLPIDIDYEHIIASI